MTRGCEWASFDGLGGPKNVSKPIASGPPSNRNRVGSKLAGLSGSNGFCFAPWPVKLRKPNESPAGVPSVLQARHFRPDVANFPHAPGRIALVRLGLDSDLPNIIRGSLKMR